MEEMRGIGKKNYNYIFICKYYFINYFEVYFLSLESGRSTTGRAVF